MIPNYKQNWCRPICIIGTCSLGPFVIAPASKNMNGRRGWGGGGGKLLLGLSPICS